ncbi:hypothetical protein QR680_007322 [Steinernema hermaphroditum]|uniref:Pre-mRNA-processing factor 17 n=1 Tax=Steinernema hermaphroditum TaxID=289476 RepID=A0AA39ICU0_9BILA|nr:hypothetical protein QR680_007322 [Steinernema hermaphroditum]
MDQLMTYADSDEEISPNDRDESVLVNQAESVTIPALKMDNLQVAPIIVSDHDLALKVAVPDPNTKELSYNPKYEELFRAAAGPSNPFKTEREKAQKNMLTGFVEPAHFDRFHFERNIRSFDTLGYAVDPSAEAGNQFVGDVKKAKETAGASMFDGVKTGGEKRKRTRNFDASDVDGYTGPWARYDDEVTVSKPNPELQKEMDEIVKKKRMQSRMGRKKLEEEMAGNAEEMCTFHLKESRDYQGRSWMEQPLHTGVNLRADYVPEKCFIPKRCEFTYRGHNKAINALRWFPQSAHMFMSCSMDTKIKLWEVYNNHRVVMTYSGHRMPVKDVQFNNTGNEFLSASFDRFIKLWDTETGQVKQRFHTGHIPFCVKFNPDADKQNMFLAGMQNKKIIQWDTRSGEIVQEYDRHLGPVNSITFFDKNRRFCSTSDDKSLRIWEWEIPVDTKLIQNAGLHSIPTMTKSPTEKWIVGQSMDNRVVLFQLIDDKLRFAKKKAFRGHTVTGYACSVDFSPDMSFLISGDSEGKLFVWDWRTHKIVARWKAHEQPCISALWHPHEKSRILTGGLDGLVKMWN